MQVTPSNNLLNALSGLQANRRPTPAPAGVASFQAAVQQSAGTEPATATTSLKAATTQPVPPVPGPAAQPIQSRRASFLGQHLDITV